MNENLKFYKGLESNLSDISNIEIGALYHCEDTGNTYIGVSNTELKLYSSAVGKKIISNNIVLGESFGDCDSNTLLDNSWNAYAHAEGVQTSAGKRSHAEGYLTFANNTSHAEGRLAQATGKGAHAEGMEQNRSFIDSAGKNETITLAQQVNINSNKIVVNKIPEELQNFDPTSNIKSYIYLAQKDSTSANKFTATDSKMIIAIDTTTKEITLNSPIKADNYLSSDFSGNGEVIPAGAYVKCAQQVLASGKGAHGEGIGTSALGDASHSEGELTIARSNHSHAEGYQTRAEGVKSHTEGNYTQTTAEAAHAEGSNSKATAIAAHAEGAHTLASGLYSHAEGGNQEITTTGTVSVTIDGQVIKGPTASGKQSHAEGTTTFAAGYSSHAEGRETYADGTYAHTEGFRTKASGNAAHAEGRYTEALGDNQHVIGQYNVVDNGQNTLTPYHNGEYIHIIGNGTSSKRSNAHTIDWNGNAWFAGDVYIKSSSGTNKDNGSEKLATEDKVNKKMDKTNPSGSGAFSLNRNTGTNIGSNSVAVGTNTSALAANCFAEGEWTQAGASASSGSCAHAEGYHSQATGAYSHAEGQESRATGLGSHAEGGNKTPDGTALTSRFYSDATYSKPYTTAEGRASHAEGTSTYAKGYSSHTEGYQTYAKANHSHAEGYWAETHGVYSHAEGCGTVASYEAQHVQGKYNKINNPDEDGATYAHIVGWGTGSTDNQRKNIHTIDTDGNAWFAGGLNLGGTKYDEGTFKISKDGVISGSVLEVTSSIETPVLNVTSSIETPFLNATSSIKTPNLEVTSSIETPILKATSSIETSQIKPEKIIITNYDVVGTEFPENPTHGQLFFKIV